MKAAKAYEGGWDLVFNQESSKQTVDIKTKLSTYFTGFSSKCGTYIVHMGTTANGTEVTLAE